MRHGAPASDTSRSPGARRRVLRRAAAAACALALLAACAQAPTEPPLRFTRPVVLLGEVHDNAQQHALRAKAFADWLAAGARPALLMEQLDRERQGRLDRLRERTPAPDADAVIAAAGGHGWNWGFYRPYIALALRYDLPIVAVNVSRDEARAVMREGLAATGFDARLPPELLDRLAEEIEASHCGTLDRDTARRMALAQVARDQAMARAVNDHAARGVLLLAGNGHVRRDAGVPRWLAAATLARTESVGLLEEGSGDDGRYDLVVHTPAQTRDDPCASLRGNPLQPRPQPAPPPAAK